VILLTDGEHNTPSITPEDAADLAAALKIKVYTIGVLSESPVGRSGIDEKRLKAISERTGARYFSADNPEALAAVYKEIGSLEKSSVGRERFERFTELTPWFALPAVALILLEVLLAATWLRRSDG
jgi:Ca-activated chloride channel family protein